MGKVCAELDSLEKKVVFDMRFEPVGKAGVVFVLSAQRV